MTSSRNPDNDSGLTFLSHLIELRDRLLRIVLIVAILFGILALASNDLYSFLAKPLLAYMPKGSGMIATEVASSFFVPIKLALIAAVFLAVPYILYHLWAFVAPALYAHEKRLILPLLMSSITLFYCGVAFAYFVVSPLMFEFFFSTTPEGVAMMTDISSYLDFVLTIFFAFGLAFEVPNATILLVWMGMITPWRDSHQIHSSRRLIAMGTPGRGARMGKDSLSRAADDWRPAGALRIIPVCAGRLPFRFIR